MYHIGLCLVSFYMNDAGEGGLRQSVHFGKPAPSPAPLPPGKRGEEPKEDKTVGLHSDFARRLLESYILKLLDRVISPKQISGRFVQPPRGAPGIRG